MPHYKQDAADEAGLAAPAFGSADRPTPLVAHVGQAAAVGSQNVEAPGTVAALDRAQSEEQSGSIVQEKLRATLAAHLALKGYALHELSCGGYLISRWDRTSHCSDLGAVHGFVRRVLGVQ